MSNVINFIEKEKTRPSDLMTFKELEIKHGYKYGFLYKWACLECQIPLYSTAPLKVSEHDVLKFDEKRIEGKYGRNKQKTI